MMVRCALTFCCPSAMAFMLLAGCENQLGSDTTQLLENGSEKVCVAPDIQSTLRDMILPSRKDFSDSDLPKETIEELIESLQVSFALATQDSVDDRVNKITCSAKIRVQYTVAPSERFFAIVFTVSPNASGSGDFVVSSDVKEANAYSLSLVTARIAMEQARLAVEQREAEKQEMLKVVNSNWIVGSWTSSVIADCSRGAAIIFSPENRFENRRGSGNWKLDEDRLTLVRPETADESDTELKIIAASANEFTAMGQGGLRGVEFRNFRCSPTRTEESAIAG